MAKDTVKEDRATCAEWLREMADKIESGQVKSMFFLGVEHDGGTDVRLSLLVPEPEEFRALAELLFWIEVYRDYGKNTVGKAVVGTASRGDSPLETER